MPFHVAAHAHVQPSGLLQTSLFVCRRMKAERSPSSNADRVEKWTQLAQATFALAAAAAWALPLLDLLLRVQINVLGRHLYFASLRGDGQ